MRYSIEEINQTKASLFEANRKADEETLERGKTFDASRKFPLRLQITEKSTPFEFKGVEYTKEKSDISGADRLIYGTNPKTYTIPKFDEARVTASVAPPLYYIVPPQWQEVIAIIEAHGIEFQRTKEPLIHRGRKLSFYRAEMGARLRLKATLR